MSCSRPCSYGAKCKGKRCRCAFNCHGYHSNYICLVKYADSSGDYIEEIVYHQSSLCEVALTQCMSQESYAFTPVYEENECFRIEDILYGSSTVSKVKNAVEDGTEDYDRNADTFRSEFRSKYQLCENSNCRDNGICYKHVDEVGYRCECRMGFTGENCEVMKSKTEEISCDSTVQVNTNTSLQLVSTILLLLLTIKMFCGAKSKSNRETSVSSSSDLSENSKPRIRTSSSNRPPSLARNQTNTSYLSPTRRDSTLSQSTLFLPKGSFENLNTAMCKSEENLKTFDLQGGFP